VHCRTKNIAFYYTKTNAYLSIGTPFYSQIIIFTWFNVLLLVNYNVFVAQKKTTVEHVFFER